MPILFFKFFGSILLFCFFSLQSCAQADKISPKAVKGVLDLREWDFDPSTGSGTDGIVNLDGEWEFNWIEDQNQIGKSYINVPHTKEEILLRGKKSELKGIYIYKLNIKLKNQTESLSIRPGLINTSYNIYWNNTLIGRTGVVGSDIQKCTPSAKPGIYDIPSISEVNVLKIEVCNNDVNTGGVIQSIILGSKDSLLKKRELNIGIESIIAGGIFLIGIYHIGLFNARRTDYSSLYFGLFCSSIFIFSITNGELFIYNLFPNLIYHHKVKIDYSSTIFGSVFLVLFISSIFKEDQSIIFTKIYIIFCSLLFLFMGSIDILNYPNIFEYILINVIICMVYLTVTMLKVIYYKRPESRYMLSAFLILLLFVTNDLLNEYGYLRNGFYFPLGLFIVIFIQSYILTRRFSNAYIYIENLSHNLQLSNQQLELTKERATKAYLDLEASQKQLVISDKMITLGTMVAGVAHEINTPLGAIKANSENILDSMKGLVQKINPNHSNITMEDLQNVNYLLEISKEPLLAISSREARTIRKKVISLLEKKDQNNVELIADYILELGLIDALESGEKVFSHTNIEKFLSLASDLYGIQKKSKVIHTSADRVSKIVKSLKSFMHFDQEEKKTVSDLTEGMETVLIILHNKIKYGIEVTKNYSEDLVPIPCYPDELNQIWTNLIHNAIQAMDEKGTLQIDIENSPNLQGIPDIDKRNPNYSGEYVSVSIQDSGSGISPEIRSKIFEAFFTTKPAGEGSGLGLHIIGKILEKHAGALYLESEPGKTRFTVVLPVL